MKQHLVTLGETFRLIVIGTSLLAASNVNAGDWPQFRGTDRTGVSQERGLLRAWPPEGPPLIWQAKGAGRGYASVSIAGDRLYTMGDGPSTARDKDEYLLCFALSDGKPLWKTRLGAPWNKGAGNWEGSRSTPTVDGTRVYALTAHGELICLETETGRELWRRHLKKDFRGKKADGWGYSESVLVDGERVICTPGGKSNTMVALNKGTGELVWTVSRPGDRGAGHASIVVSEVAGVRVYVQTTGGGALGVRAEDGKLLWSYKIGRTTAVIPTPIVRDDLVFFTAGYGRGGALLRQVADGAGGVTVREIYPLNKDLQNKHGGVLLFGDHLYGDSGSSGKPFCADLMTGKVLWREKGSGRGSAALTCADGHLYIRFSNGVMALAEATPGRYEESGSFRIPGKTKRPSWSHPVVCGGRLYLRENDTILCYDLRERDS